MDAEKTGRTDIATRSQADALHEHNEDEGYILRKDGGESGDGDGPGPGPGPKLAPNGLTILIPQPSDDADDPVNWPWRKKHLCLLVVALAAFLPDFGSATGAVTLIPQAQQWRISEDTVNHSQAGNVFTVGAGGLFAVALSAYFGRLPVVFWFLLVALVTAVWEAGTNDFESFMAARILNGLFSSVSQAGGLMFIQDMFFFHERARKINVWA